MAVEAVDAGEAASMDRTEEAVRREHRQSLSMR